TKKRQTSKEDAFRLKAEPLLEALDSAIFQKKASCAKTPRKKKNAVKKRRFENSGSPSWT
ncbi:hypothetical protein, partial [uncultured Parasutterella sp.]|uniref:hypothetical protein n=1 Tax=uncultured Parasutterella sp. TaxID=1263098 RepID=UPI0025B45319